MERPSHAAKQKLDLLHILLVVMIAAAALLTLAGTIEFSLHVPIELE